jgi:hypothetical protein
MKPKILLVNPPIYDFAAYDFWLKPYGLLRIAGRLRKGNNLYLFDYLDRHHPALRNRPASKASGDITGGLVSNKRSFKTI